MRSLYLFLRRVAGFIGLLFGGHQAWEARKALKNLDAKVWASRIISDSVLLNDIPSPSDSEALRMKFISKRLEEFGISNVFTDEWGNVIALFPAYGSRKDFLVLIAEVGDADYSPLDNSVHLNSHFADGQGLGERSLGPAALLVFAEFAQATGFHLEKNILILFTPSSSVDEREDSFRHFLTQWADRISAVLLVHGTNLGTVETKHIGSYRLSVHVQAEERSLLATGHPASAASTLGTMAHLVENISKNGPPNTVVSIARMQSGGGFGHWATQGEMDIEIVSDDEKALEALKHEVTETIEKSVPDEKSQVEIKIRFKRSVGDPKLNEPLISALKSALNKIRVKPEEGLLSDKISLVNEKGIPGISLGITRATANQKKDEIELEPIPSGFRQLLLVIEGATQAIGKPEVDNP